MTAQNRSSLKETFLLAFTSCAPECSFLSPHPFPPPVCTRHFFLRRFSILSYVRSRMSSPPGSCIHTLLSLSPPTLSRPCQRKGRRELTKRPGGPWISEPLFRETGKGEERILPLLRCYEDSLILHFRRGAEAVLNASRYIRG